MGLEEEVRAALGRRYGSDTLHRLERILDEADYRAHPDEARLAARTLLERTPRTTAEAYLRGLFARARAGDLLCDRRKVADETVRAELDAMLGPADVPREERIAELESRLAAVQLSGGDPERVRELERALGELRPRPPPTTPARPVNTRSEIPPPRAAAPPPVGPDRGTSERAAAYVDGLPPHLRALFVPTP